MDTVKEKISRLDVLSDAFEKQMEKIIEFSAAYDKRDPNPAKNYGIHGVDIRFVLKGEEGAVQFLLYTGWQLPHVREELNDSFLEHPRRVSLECMFPQPANLGYHSPKPMYPEDKPMIDSCPYLDGKPCYYNGSGLAAERVYERLLSEGDAGVWLELEKYYDRVFKGSE